MFNGTWNSSLSERCKIVFYHRVKDSKNIWRMVYCTLYFFDPGFHHTSIRLHMHFFSPIGVIIIRHYLLYNLYPCCVSLRVCIINIML